MDLSSRPAAQCLVALLFCLAAALSNVCAEPAARTREDEATLVVYSYRHTEPDALDNLQYFVSTVIKPQDSARYIFVVDHAMQQHGHMSSHGLPKLPTNAEYLTIRDCFELGHVGKVLLGNKSSVHVNMEQYKYFVWLDSSAKGPLLPSHTVQGDRAPAWHTLLTSRITATTKLVGANIICQPVREDFIPHVEATLMATDSVGLEVLQNARCFDCYATWHEAKMKGEIAASAAMLDAGYNLDCFNPPYQGVNWRDKRAWPCAKTVRQHPQEAATDTFNTHVEKFRSQGGEGFEAPQDEEYDLEALEAAQKHSGQHREQKVSDSLKEAGFVKPLQHENPDADQEETARIGGRLVESGFGRLQFEDAMEHAQRRQRGELKNADGVGQTAEIIDGAELDHLARADHASNSNSQHANRAHVTDAAEHAGASHALTQADTEPAELHMTEFENQIFPAEAQVKAPEEGINPTHAGRTHMAELGQNPALTEPQADETVQLVHPGRTHETESEADRVSDMCPELVAEPTPRQGLQEQNEAAQLAAEVAELDHAQGMDIAFYGDSITNLWKYGVPGHSGRSNAFWDSFGAYTSSILAVGGDQTSHLWWRLLNGETFEQHPPQVSVVLIGVNDLGAAATCGSSYVTDAAAGVAERTVHIVSHLQQQNPDTVILLVGILPVAEETSPNAEGVFQWPNLFSPAVGHVNQALETFASQHSLVHYIDCADDMLTNGQISETVLSDGLHPNAAGMARLASCLKPSIDRFVKAPQAD